MSLGHIPGSVAPQQAGPVLTWEVAAEVKCTLTTERRTGHRPLGPGGSFCFKRRKLKPREGDHLSRVT